MVATVLAAGCGSGPPGGVASIPSGSEGEVVTTMAGFAGTGLALETGDLVAPDVRTVGLDGNQLMVAWADNAGERSRGLMDVTDLGDLDGMLFDLETERLVSFTMRNTLIPLDLLLFDAGGTLVASAEMVPCEGEPCRSYPLDAPGRFAIEVPAGTVDFSSDSQLDIAG